MLTLMTSVSLSWYGKEASYKKQLDFNGPIERFVALKYERTLARNLDKYLPPSDS